MWRGFGWQTACVDGYDIETICKVLKNNARRLQGAPLVVIAKTVKGKGISFMENNNEWHHNVLTQARYDAAMAELAPEESNT
jgi:transketolase